MKLNLSVESVANVVTIVMAVWLLGAMFAGTLNVTKWGGAHVDYSNEEDEIVEENEFAPQHSGGRLPGAPIPNRRTE